MGMEQRTEEIQELEVVFRRWNWGKSEFAGFGDRLC